MKLTTGKKTIRTWKDWARPKRDYQWRSGRSAMELARAWFTSSVPVMPIELRRLLDRSRVMKGFHADRGYPERITRLPESGEHRNHDLVLHGKVGKRAAVVCIEAKVDEGFGDQAGKYYRTKLETRSGVPKRIDALLRILFGVTAKDRGVPWRSLRYQLLTAGAGSVLEARAAGADLAVFVVHVFVTDRANRRTKVPRNQRHYEAFVRALIGDQDAQVEPGRLYGPFECTAPDGSRVDLLVGEIVDDWGA
jgi:hypothetical protein